jgi:hypothetical protein
MCKKQRIQKNENFVLHFSLPDLKAVINETVKEEQQTG